MSKTRRFFQSALSAADFPGEILTGVPTVEVHGDSEATVVNHCGILAYDIEQICIGSVLGTVRIAGKKLSIYRMNRERITVHGKICIIQIGEDVQC